MIEGDLKTGVDYELSEGNRVRLYSLLTESFFCEMEDLTSGECGKVSKAWFKANAIEVAAVVKKSKLKSKRPSVWNDVVIAPSPADYYQQVAAAAPRRTAALYTGAPVPAPIPATPRPRIRPEQIQVLPPTPRVAEPTWTWAEHRATHDVDFRTFVPLVLTPPPPPAPAPFLPNTLDDYLLDDGI